MKKYWYEDSHDWKSSPIAIWAHKENDNMEWRLATEFTPPAPRCNSEKQYKILKVQYGDVILEFSSIFQVDLFIETMKKKILPRTIDLSRQRNKKWGPSWHWLSRIPKKLKAYKTRLDLINYFESFYAGIEFY